ncbi:phosphatase PAP2 family protein [Rhodoblastus sp.]|uniref:phosphatase PAP2 family protein n=1 Tax=Rhodoblastus sp. TaxID=1962975 RepID=UPI002630DED5|nr:phosphatase PAP2 family protein [Rhodoblastus sp.]
MSGEQPPAVATANPLRARCAAAVSRVLSRFETAEMRAVRAASRSARPAPLKILAIILSKLGNGWIYPLLAAAILVKWRLPGLRIIAPAAVSAILLHSVYPYLKNWCGRRRPFQTAPELPKLLDTLDAHSFPSGHTMTMVGVLTPVVMLWPAATASAVLMGLGMAWSRVATAHHYPSDVLAGAALGFGVGYPMTEWTVRLFG